jgi:hypothetical protein
MKTLVTTLICASIALATGGATAQGTMKKDDSMSKDSMAKTMTMQECKDYMAMSMKESTKKDDAMMKKDAMCADMMKKEGAMKKDGMPAEPMKK